MIVLCTVCKEMVSSNSTELYDHPCRASFEVSKEITYGCRNCNQSVYFSSMKLAWNHMWYNDNVNCKKPEPPDVNNIAVKRDVDHVDSRAWQ